MIRFPKFSVPHGTKGIFRQGAGTQWGRANVDISAAVTVGDNCIIADDVKIFTHRHVFDNTPISPKGGIIENVPLAIGDSVGIGYGVIILPQVESIGSHVGIGAGSVVTKDIPENEIWAGNPARKIGQREIK